MNSLNNNGQEQIMSYDQVMNKENEQWRQYQDVTAKSTSVGQTQQVSIPSEMEIRRG